MGTWGTGISSNDTYADVYGEFFDLYDDGVDVGEISTKLIESFRETLDDEDDSGNFSFALAKAQWECKELDPQLLLRIERIVESKSDLEVWRRLGASEADVRKRGAVLEQFLARLRSERKTARKRKKKEIVDPPFEKGQCLLFRLANGNYGGAVVLESISCKGFGLNLVVVTRLNCQQRPSLGDFLGAEVLVKSFAAWQDTPEICWQYDSRFLDDKHLFEPTEKVVVKKNYDPNDYHLGAFFSGSWASMIDSVNMQNEWESKNPRPRKKLRIRDLVQNRRWGFW